MGRMDIACAELAQFRIGIPSGALDGLLAGQPGDALLVVARLVAAGDQAGQRSLAGGDIHGPDLPE